MASAAKIAANRANAQRSTGPRTAAAKARTRHNAFQHGLSIPASFDHSATQRVDDLRGEFFWETLDPAQREVATLIAEAQVDIERVRQVKVDLINQSAKRLASGDDHELSAGERTTLAFAQTVKVVAACDRYEKRALSRRKRALRTYTKLHAAEIRTSDFSKRVGPPVPQRRRIKDRDNLFEENSLTLDLGELLRRVTKREPRPYGTPVNWSRTLEWGSDKQTVASMRVSLRLEADSARLALQGSAGEQEIRQELVVTRTPAKVGGVMWSVQCPETGKTVRYLYLLPGQRHFRSRHALKLTYRSNKLRRSYRYSNRVSRLLERLGGGDPEFKPPRPKYMRRATYKWLCAEISYADMRAWCARSRELGLGRIKCP